MSASGRKADMDAVGPSLRTTVQHRNPFCRRLAREMTRHLLRLPLGPMGALGEAQRLGVVRQSDLLVESTKRGSFRFWLHISHHRTILRKHMDKRGKQIKNFSARLLTPKPLILIMVRTAGVVPARPIRPQDFKSCVSTNSTTSARRAGRVAKRAPRQGRPFPRKARPTE